MRGLKLHRLHLVIGITTSKAAPAAKPSMPTPGTSSWTPTNPPIFGPSPGTRLGTDDEQEIQITHLNPDVFKGPMKVKVEPGSERPRSRPEGMADYGEGMRHARSTRRERSPAPTQQYSPGDTGITGINTPPDFNDVPGDSGRLPGDDPPGDGDGDGDDDDGNNPNFPPNDRGDDSGKTRKDKKKGTAPPGSGPPAGDDNDPPSDDSDEKFRRRMIKFLGGSIEPKSDDKPKVEEADTIKIPAFPLAETYRNWRIKTREAVVAASTDPDNGLQVGQ